MSLVISVIGILCLLAIGWLLSKHKSKIKWRTVFTALAIQFLFGGFVLFVPFGQDVLLATSNGFMKVLSFAAEGISFVLGGFYDISKYGFVFAIHGLLMIIYLASLISVLYHLGVMKIVIALIGGGLQKLLGTSRTESLSAAANIFVGQTEAPLTVKPYISKMTESELFAVMAGGLASVAGSILAGYIAFGVPAPYLIAASFMAAPGGLLFAKLIIPETEKIVDDSKEDSVEEDRAANILEAAARGASDGMFLVINVAAMLIAFLSLIGLINGIFGWIGSWFGQDDFSLQFILGWLFRPLAFVIGVPWEDSALAGRLIGIKLITNEFVGYLELKQHIIQNIDQGGIFAGWKDIDPKTGIIVSFALCGFANLGSIAILIGGLGVMAPSRRSDVARLGILAVCAGALSNTMSATIAGFFYSLSDTLG